MDAAAKQHLSQYVKSLMRQRPNTAPLLLFDEPRDHAPKVNHKPPRKTLRSVDLFTGAGGLSVGLERAGFRPEVAVEMNADACVTFSQVFPDTPITPKPIEQFNFHAFEGIDLVAGGPPCQPFSSGGKRLAAKDDRDVIPQFIRAVEEARPRAFLMENVSALFGATHRSYLNGAVGRLAALGYQVEMAVLNAAEYGVPQKRRRGFLVGLRNDRFRFPRPTHGPRGS